MRLDLEPGEEVRAMITWERDVLILTNYGNCWIMRRSGMRDWVLERLFTSR